jgi:hypothetical protein
MADIDRFDERSRFAASVVENNDGNAPSHEGSDGAEVSLLLVSLIAPLREKMQMLKASETVLWCEEMIELGLSQEQYAKRIGQSVTTVKRNMVELGPGLRRSMQTAAALKIETAIQRLLQVTPVGMTEKEIREAFSDEDAPAYKSAKRYGVVLRNKLADMVSAGVLTREGPRYKAAKAHTVTSLPSRQAKLAANAAAGRNAVEATLLQEKNVNAGTEQRCTILVRGTVCADEDMDALFGRFTAQVQEGFTEPEARLAAATATNPKAPRCDLAVTIAMVPTPTTRRIP